VVMRNWHFREFWMRSALRGCERAMADGDFARIAGAGFGGLNVHPLGILQQVAASILRYLGEGAMNTLRSFVVGSSIGDQAVLEDLVAWQNGWKKSISADPDWHAAWLNDVMKKAAQLGPSLLTRENPRVRGLLV
jgi:menaquinone-9 beta-reductase